MQPSSVSINTYLRIRLYYIPIDTSVISVVSVKESIDIANPALVKHCNKRSLLNIYFWKLKGYFLWTYMEQECLCQDAGAHA